MRSLLTQSGTSLDSIAGDSVAGDSGVSSGSSAPPSAAGSSVAALDSSNSRESGAPMGVAASQALDASTQNATPMPSNERPNVSFISTSSPRMAAALMGQSPITTPSVASSAVLTTTCLSSSGRAG